jgi:hypothetical protein
MRQEYPYLQDQSFLSQIGVMTLKEQVVKITVLTLDEAPIEDIQGRVTAGSISVDGNSSVRRTANLTLIADEYKNDLTDINNLLSLNKKIQLFTGFKNTTDLYPQFPILWFPLGIYVIINASISSSSSGIMINLQLKDKMCLLNGECGGVIPASTTFHEMEQIGENGNILITQPTIYQIVQEVVNHFGGEQLGKIIISGLNTRIKKVMKWIGTKNLYLIKSNDGKSIYTIDSDKIVSLPDSDYEEYQLEEDVGYIYTDFTYPGELVVDAGATVTEVLDKIKETLGNYEYYYDIDGNFIFQEIKNYLNNKYSKELIEGFQKSEIPYTMDISKGKTVYRFDDRNIITSYSNTPQYNMIKNDFIIWGVRKDSTGKEFSIRYHLAIDEKPSLDKGYENYYYVLFYFDSNDKSEKIIVPTSVINKQSLPKTGKEGDWFIYYDNEIKIVYWDNEKEIFKEIELKDQNGNDSILYADEENSYLLYLVHTVDWRSELFLQGAAAEQFGIDSNYYYTELKNEWLKIYDLKQKIVECPDKILKAINQKYFHNNNIDNSIKVVEGGFRDIVNNKIKMQSLDYYLDFIDTGSRLGDISVKKIGRRTKVLNDPKVNCIFAAGIPDYVFINKSIDAPASKSTAALRQECLREGQDFVQVEDNIYQSLEIGGNLNDAYTAIQDLLYQYTSYNETININCLPIYFLEPNTRIGVFDERTGIQGDYIISSFNLPLDIAGTMSISAIRALDKI